MTNPYSITRQHNDLLFVSGQILTEKDGSVKEQTLKILNQIQVINSLDKKAFLKTTVYITDINNLKGVNEAYESFFDDLKPTRSLVEVNALAQNAEVEIDAILSLS